MKSFLLKFKFIHENKSIKWESNARYLLGRKIIAVCLALVFFTTSCTQYELDAPESNVFKSSDGFEKSMITQGEVFLNSIIYIKDFHYIFDENEFDPFVFVETGEKHYDEEIKLINRLIHFYDSLEYRTDKLFLKEIVERIQYFSFHEAVIQGAQEEALNYANQIKNMFENKSQLLFDFESDLRDWKERVLNDPNLSQLSIKSLMFGYDMSVSYLKHGEQNGAILVADLELPDVFGIPCGAAVVLYAAALVSVCALTGGTAAVVVASTWVGFGGSIWGLFSSCN